MLIEKRKGSKATQYEHVSCCRSSGLRLLVLLLVSQMQNVLHLVPKSLLTLIIAVSAKLVTMDVPFTASPRMEIGLVLP